MRLPSIIHDRAVERACAELFGLALAVPEDGDAPHLNGLTTPMLARTLVAEAGHETPPDTWDAWPAAMSRAYCTLAATLPAQQAVPDAAHALQRAVDAGCAIGLLTGNYRDIARHKLEAANLWRPEFDMGHGAFGEDADDRNALGRIARERAMAVGVTNIVIIGDTPRDIGCARAANALAVAVTTGTATRHELSHADIVADDLLGAVEQALRGRGPR